MNVTSATQTEYTQATNKSKNNQEVYDPFKGQDYVLNTLDDEGNKLLNDALVGKSDEKKWLIKLGLDMELSTEVKEGTLSNKTTVDNSKENVMGLLDAFIQRRKELATPDMIGVGATAEKLLEAYKASGSSFNIQNQENSVVDKFLKDLYPKESIGFKSTIIKDKINNKVNEYAQKLMDERGNIPKSELETSKLLNQYKKELLQDYQQSIENSNDNGMSSEQQAIIKVLLEENTKEASSLETLLSQTSTATNLTKTVSTDPKMAEMQEKYKDVYTPVPETYSKADEDLQSQKIHEAYPNYISGQDFLKIVNKFYDGKPLQLSQKPTQDQIDKQKIAFDKAYEMFGGQEAFTKMQKDVQAIQAKYPVNTLAKEGVSNAKEITRFENAAVYEGLQSGKTVDEAKRDALSLSFSFMDKDFLRDKFIKSIGQTGGTYEPDPIVYAPQNPLWDLRDYGIDGQWEANNIYKNDSAMISELNKKIDQFNFMLNNKDVIEAANNKLDPSNRKMMDTYQSRILDDKLPKVQMALDIFKNYKIYDS